MRADSRLLFVILAIACTIFVACDSTSKVARLDSVEGQTAPASIKDKDIDNTRDMPGHTAAIVKLLPGHTESVFAVQESFRLLTGDELRESTSIVDLAAYPAYGWMELPLDGEAYRAIAGSTCIGMVLAGRRFRPSNGMGVSRFDGACILRFRDNFQDDVWANLCGNAEQRSVQGVSVVDHHVEADNDERVLSLAMLNNNILIVTTDVDYLNSILANAKKEVDVPGIPSTWEEWKHLDTRASIWGIRHFSRNKNNKDPTSPFYKNRDMSDVLNRRPEGFEWNVPDPDAIGFTFSFDQERKGEPCVVNYLSKSTAAEQLATIAWTTPPPQTALPIVERIGATVIKMTFRDTVINDSGSYLLMLLARGRLGHAVW